MKIGSNPDTLVVEQLCRDATMVGLYTHTLYQLWHREPWVLTERYAERSWAHLVEMQGGPPWLEIRDFVRDLWMSE